MSYYVSNKAELNISSVANDFIIFHLESNAASIRNGIILLKSQNHQHFLLKLMETLCVRNRYIAFAGTPSE